MRIRSSKIFLSDINRACPEGVYLADGYYHTGTGKDGRWFHDVALRSRNGTRRPLGTRDDDYAATWDEWGIFLWNLFQIDPHMKAGRYYHNYWDFTWKTCGRFDTVKAIDPNHLHHRFTYMGTPQQNECRCGAKIRWTIPPSRQPS